jgi:hypothetical protein
VKQFVLSLGIAALLTGIPGVSVAESFERIEGRDSFLSLVKDRALTRLGIRLQVTHDGQIKGRAFGREVSGDWKWQSGYFCRDLYVGGDELGANCQLVQVNGNTIRFTSDQGQGEYADLRIK